MRTNLSYDLSEFISGIFARKALADAEEDLRWLERKLAERAKESTSFSGSFAAELLEEFALRRKTADLTST